MKYFKNIYVIIFAIFAVWMLFFDTNSIIIHNESNKEIDKLNDQSKYYEKGIEKDQKEFETLTDTNGIETYGRENYYMKKENEEIFIIEYQDSTNTKEDE